MRSTYLGREPSIWEHNILIFFRKTPPAHHQILISAPQVLCTSFQISIRRSSPAVPGGQHVLIKNIRRDSLAARAAASLCSRQHDVCGNVFSCLIVHDPRQLPLSRSRSLSLSIYLPTYLSLLCLSGSLVSMLSALLSVLSCDLSST